MIYYIVMNLPLWHNIIVTFPDILFFVRTSKMTRTKKGSSCVTSKEAAIFQLIRLKEKHLSRKLSIFLHISGLQYYLSY